MYISWVSSHSENQSYLDELVHPITLPASVLLTQTHHITGTETTLRRRL